MSIPPKLVPPEVELPRTASDDPRIGHLLGRSISKSGASVVLVGFPSDEGVRINGGRTGAAAGPSAIRKWLYTMTPDPTTEGGWEEGSSFRALIEHTIDLGDLPVSGNVADDQERLGEVLAPHLSRGAVPIILGGGHETAFGHFLGYVRAGRTVEIVNWDAHPDVRPLKDGLPHSGSPFYQALRHESGTCREYRAIGLAPHACAGSHLEFIRSCGGSFRWADEVDVPAIEAIHGHGADRSPRAVSGRMVTFDLDAVHQAEAPGVSAPNPAGLRSELWLRAARAAGRDAAVSSFDIVELNPRYDVDEHTARLAALTVWTFMRGMAERAGGTWAHIGGTSDAASGDFNDDLR